jgi:hypothetical protein
MIDPCEKQFIKFEREKTASCPVTFYSLHLNFFGKYFSEFSQWEIFFPLHILPVGLLPPVTFKKIWFRMVTPLSMQMKGGIGNIKQETCHFYLQTPCSNIKSLAGVTVAVYFLLRRNDREPNLHISMIF